MEWGEPVLLRYDFEVKGRPPATVRVGFPQYIEDQRWICAFQFRNVGTCADVHLKDGDINRVTGYSGMEALIAASNAIRLRFEELVDVRSRVPYELVFPKFLPTRRGARLYDWARELVASEMKQKVAAAPTTIEQLSRSTWDEPMLLHYLFKFAGRRKVAIRLGFPTYSQAVRNWTCAFQLCGLKDNQIRKVSGENGLLAVANAADLIRLSLGQIGAAPADKVNLGLSFPAHLPTECGLELHRQLSARISAKIKQVEQEYDEKKEKRAMRFKEILAGLAPSARL